MFILKVCVPGFQASVTWKEPVITGVDSLSDTVITGEDLVLLSSFVWLPLCRQPGFVSSVWFAYYISIKREGNLIWVIVTENNNTLIRMTMKALCCLSIPLFACLICRVAPFYMWSPNMSAVLWCAAVTLHPVLPQYGRRFLISLNIVADRYVLYIPLRREFLVLKQFSRSCL